MSNPPPDDAAKAKTPSANLTPTQLRRRKVETIKLCIAFAYATKHYLRGEDGLDWEDYAGILPASAARLARGAYAPANKDYRYRDGGAATKSPSAYTSYAATDFTSRRGSGENTGASTPGLEVDVERGRVRDTSADATKRIRVKRSKDRLKAAGKTAATPLMSSLQHTIDFSTDPDALSTPLPMVYARLFLGLQRPPLTYTYRLAHELSRALFKFRRDGYLETVGPAGVNAMNTLYAPSPHSLIWLS